MSQCYVNEVEADEVLEGFKLNAKGGVTISVLKRGGWESAFNSAKKMARWDLENSET